MHKCISQLFQVSFFDRQVPKPVTTGSYSPWRWFHRIVGHLQIIEHVRKRFMWTIPMGITAVQIFQPTPGGQGPKGAPHGCEHNSVHREPVACHQLQYHQAHVHRASRDVLLAQTNCQPWGGRWHKSCNGRQWQIAFIGIPCVVSTRMPTTQQKHVLSNTKMSQETVYAVATLAKPWGAGGERTKLWTVHGGGRKKRMSCLHSGINRYGTDADQRPSCDLRASCYLHLWPSPIAHNGFVLCIVPHVVFKCESMMIYYCLSGFLSYTFHIFVFTDLILTSIESNRYIGMSFTCITKLLTIHKQKGNKTPWNLSQTLDQNTHHWSVVDSAYLVNKAWLTNLDRPLAVPTPIVPPPTWHGGLVVAGSPGSGSKAWWQKVQHWQAPRYTFYSMLFWLLFFLPFSWPSPLFPNLSHFSLFWFLFKFFLGFLTCSTSCWSSLNFLHFLLSPCIFTHSTWFSQISSSDLSLFHPAFKATVDSPSSLSWNMVETCTYWLRRPKKPLECRQHLSSMILPTHKFSSRNSVEAYIWWQIHWSVFTYLESPNCLWWSGLGLVTLLQQFEVMWLSTAASSVPNW